MSNPRTPSMHSGDVEHSLRKEKNCASVVTRSKITAEHL